METRWLSYDEIAAALRITPASARRLVARNKQWPCKNGNDGRVRIGFPVERLPPDRPTDANPGASDDVRPGAPPDGLDVRATIAALNAHVETLKGMLAKAEAGGDAARRELLAAQAEAAYVPALRTTVELLKAALDGEKARVRALRQQRDRPRVRRGWWPFRRAG